MRIGLLMTLIFFSITASAKEIRDVRIPWGKVAEAVGYEFQLNEKVHSVSEPSIELKLPPGDYSFRLRSVDPAGGKSVWTKWQKFTIHSQSIFSQNTEGNEKISDGDKGSLPETIAGAGSGAESSRASAEGVSSSRKTLAGKNAKEKTELPKALPLVGSGPGKWEGEIPRLSALNRLLRRSPYRGVGGFMNRKN